MYIRTPKKYRGRQRRSIFPVKRFLGILFMLALIVIGVGIYQNRDMIQPHVERVAGTAISQFSEQAATITAPTPTPTEDPTNALVQANNFWAQGSVNEALRLYEPVLDAVPNDVTVYYRMALGMIAQGEIERALEYAEHTVTADPYSADAWAIRAWALDWAGRPNEAIASALHARELDPENARALAYLAEAYFGAGQTDRALNVIEQALETDPDSPEVYRARAYVRQYGLFEYEQAMQDLRRAYDMARETNPAAANIIAIDIAQLEIRNQDYDAATATLEGVLEANPESTQALYLLGVTYLRGYGDPTQANAYLLRCVDYSPDSIPCNFWLGRTQERLDQIAAAADTFAKVIELGSENPQHYWWAGRSQISLGNCARALQYLRPGYERALADPTGQWVEDYEAILPQCQSDFAPSASPTPPADAVPEGESPADPPAEDGRQA